MNCSEAKSLLMPYGDGEALPPEQRVALEQHLETCPACAGELAQQRALGAALRTHAPYHSAPAGLRRGLAQAPARPIRAAAPAWPWLRLSGAFALGLVLALFLPFHMGRMDSEQRVLDEVVAGHVRSLMVAHLTDVASTDRHTVKPWFAGKLDFSPPVIDLAAQGFPLEGGRLDYIDGHSAAALVYRRHQHLINLYLWPSAEAADRALQERALNGYSVVRWRARGMNWWAVSDLNATELESFAQLLEQPSG